MRELDARIVCLFRRNFVKHAIAELRHQLQYEACKGKITDPWRDHNRTCSVMISATLPLEAQRYMSGDVLPDIVSMIEKSRRELTDLRATCNREQMHLAYNKQLRVMQLDYEDIAFVAADEREASLLSMSEWLTGVSLKGAPRMNSHLQKTTSPDLRAVLSNFDELARRVASRYGEGSVEHRMLMDVES